MKKKPVDLNQLLRLASIHCTLEECASVLGCEKEDILSDPVAKATFEQGALYGNASLRRSQFDLAKRSAQMAIFLGEKYLEDQKPRDTQIGIVPVFVNDYKPEGD